MKKVTKKYLLERINKLANDIRQLKADKIEVVTEPAELTELPEKWCVKLLFSNTPIISKWLYGPGNYMEPYGYAYNTKEWRNEIIEGYTEISFADFKRLVLKEEETQKLEVGKWYKLKCNPKTDKALVYLTGLPNSGYGFDNTGRWNNENNHWGWAQWDWIPATDEEVKDALIEEAKRRGFKEGVTIDRSSLPNVINNTVKLGDLGNEFNFYSTYNQALEFGNYTIFYNGTWAEIIEQPQIDWSKPGQRVQHVSIGRVVLTDGCTTSTKRFGGTVISLGNNDSRVLVGEHRDDWSQGMYKLYAGEAITL